MLKNIKFILFFVFFSFFINGQSQDQINQVKKSIEASGISKEQAIKQARMSGYSDSQIKNVLEKSASNSEKVSFTPKEDNQSGNAMKVPNENNSLNTNSEFKNSLAPENTDSRNDISNGEDLETVEDLKLSIESIYQKESTEPNYFGYEIFKKDPKFFQGTSVGAVDPSYIIGPGDEIIVMLWGETEFRQVLNVNREGFVFIPEIGQVFVNGLNLNLLESKLFRVLSQSYASLDPGSGSPTTFLDVSLGNLRPIRIQVIGEVAQPGAYTVSPSATIFSSLFYFDGPTTLGSLRNIRLIRSGEEIASIDFYDYLLTGKKPNDQKLQHDDIIFIPSRENAVVIKGEINRPGIYELKSDETLKDLLNIAGQLKVTAYLKRAQVDRIVPFELRSQYGMDRMVSDINLEDILESKKSFPTQDGDIIQIFSVLNMRQNVLLIEGAVVRPGAYEIGDGLTLSDLIIKADSLLGDAYLERVDVIRTKPDHSQKLIKLNLEKALRGDSNHDLFLQSQDYIKVYSTKEMISETFVSIIGHVSSPGKYILRENMTLYDLIFMAGGLIDKEFIKKTYLKRAELIRVKDEINNREIIPFNLDSVLNKKSISNILLKPNDAIRIYSVKEIEGVAREVRISGDVKFPGVYELIGDSMSLYDLLFKAGGFEDDIYRQKIFMKRADLIRYNDDLIHQKVIPFNLVKVLEKDPSENILMMPGDLVRVYSKKVFNDVLPVSIKGEVNKPGVYTFKTNMTLKDLILEAGGAKQKNYRFRIEISRIDPKVLDENVLSESIVLNIDKNYNYYGSDSIGDLSNLEDVILLPYDLVYIRPDPYFGLHKSVTIEGHIYYPGEYTILHNNEKISDIIERSGGLKSKANLLGIKFYRNDKIVNVDLQKILKRKNSSSNLTILNGDRIVVPPAPNIIGIQGEVNSPGLYAYKARLKIDNVIDDAGGFTLDANEKDIYIIYPNGKSKKYSKYFGNHKVLDGSKITVGKKPEKEPFDSTEYLKEMTAILASLAQVVSIIYITTSSLSP